jgi:hypothetical protein
VQELCSTELEQEIADPSLQERLAEAVWRVSIGDVERTSENEDVRASPSFKVAYEHSLKRLRWFERESKLPVERRKYSLEDLDLEKSKPDLYQIALEKMSGKRPFRTSQSWIGMGPPVAQVSDVVVVVFGGAPIPFMLRQVEDEMWLLVGECFCCGAMDSEAVQSSHKKVFHIK